jgi:hypothetical protein
MLRIGKVGLKKESADLKKEGTDIYIVPGKVPNADILNTVTIYQ